MADAAAAALPPTVGATAALLEAGGYVADTQLATTVHLALAMRRPLFLEGEPGTGKTEIAKVLAAGLGRRLVRLQCYDGMDLSAAAYEWDHAKQLMAIRLAEAAGQGTPPPVLTSTVTSAAPAQIAVTVYRNPTRTRAAPIDLRYLGGFALVTETRRVRLPRGRATLRFEGVAEGIVPVSAIVSGLPGGTVEKNRDARLLSPA